MTRRGLVGGKFAAKGEIISDEKFQNAGQQTKGQKRKGASKQRAHTGQIKAYVLEVGGSSAINKDWCRECE